MIMANTQNRLDRELDTRAVSARPTHWKAPDLLPEPNPREGWKHRWIRISMVGMADAKNISSSLREGYEFCKAEDYPEMMMHAVSDGRFKGNIEVGGLVLARIPKEFMDQRNEYYSNMNQAQLDSVDNTFLRQSDPRMPLFSEKRSETRFGKGST
jgi:hypothetical protein